MMVRPLNAAKPATTSRRSALSHVTVMRAACDCALSDAWATRYASMLEPSPLCAGSSIDARSEEHTSELQSQSNLVCRLLLEKKKKEADNELAAILSDGQSSEFTSEQSV